MSEAKEKELVTWGEGGLFGNRIVGSLLLIIGTPIFIVLFCGTCYYYEGSFYQMGLDLWKFGFFTTLARKFPSPFTVYPWKMLLTYLAFQLVLMRVVPGKEFKATVTPTGFIPTYTANGVQCYLVTIAALFALAYYKVWNPADAYDYMGSLLLDSNILALLLCIFLTFKGLHFPSTKDCGTNGHWIVDFFWGTELYPSIFGFSIKQVTNCRYSRRFYVHCTVNILFAIAVLFIEFNLLYIAFFRTHIESPTLISCTYCVQIRYDALADAAFLLRLQAVSALWLRQQFNGRLRTHPNSLCVQILPLGMRLLLHDGHPT